MSFAEIELNLCASRRVSKFSTAGLKPRPSVAAARLAQVKQSLRVGQEHGSSQRRQHQSELRNEQDWNELVKDAHFE